MRCAQRERHLHMHKQTHFLLVPWPALGQNCNVPKCHRRALGCFACKLDLQFKKLHMLAWKVYYTWSIHPAARSDCDIDVCTVSLADIQVGHQVGNAMYILYLKQPHLGDHPPGMCPDLVAHPPGMCPDLILQHQTRFPEQQVQQSCKPQA